VQTGRNAVAIRLRSFHEQNLRLDGFRWTVQVFTGACGQVDSMASGRLLRPSQHEDHIGLAPVAQLGQDRRPKLCALPAVTQPHPEHMLAAVDVNPDLQIGRPRRGCSDASLGSQQDASGHEAPLLSTHPGGA
jgi:hypothetical protein